MALEARSLEGFGRSVLAELARFIQSDMVFLLIADSRLACPSFFQL